jgi:Phophatidylserine decarboxylase
MYMYQMIEQEPGGTRRYSQRHIEDVPHLLALMNEVMTTAPAFDEQAMVMTPLNAVLDWTMATPAGFSAYRDRRINDALRTVLRGWCEFLDGPDSRYVLNDSEHGWMSPAAERAVGMPCGRHWLSVASPHSCQGPCALFSSSTPAIHSTAMRMDAGATRPNCSEDGTWLLITETAHHGSGKRHDHQTALEYRTATGAIGQWCAALAPSASSATSTGFG